MATTTTATHPTYTTATPYMTKLTPKEEDSSTNTLHVIIVATGVAVGILVVLVVVAVAILMMVMARRMKLVKRVDLLGHHSPMENPSYAIGKRTTTRPAKVVLGCVFCSAITVIPQISLRFKRRYIKGWRINIVL